MSDKMLYSVGQYIIVICKKDNKPHKCKILSVNESNNTIKIHYYRWSKTFDEIISTDSDRIVDVVGDSQEILNSSLPVSENNIKDSTCLKRCRDESSDESSTTPSTKRPSIANESSNVPSLPACRPIPDGPNSVVESEAVREAEDLIDDMHASLLEGVDGEERQRDALEPGD